MTPYHRYSQGQEKEGDLVIKFYRSGEEIRGYVRKVVASKDDDAVFPGEEMRPAAAFEIARSHVRDDHLILIELAEGGEWDRAWGDLVV